MSALFDEMIVLGHDEYIKLTTLFPSFVDTRPDLKDFVSKDIPMMSPEKVAEEAVKGILRNQRNIYIPKILKLGLPMK
jgi:short-subunit dehydrogenase